MKLYIPDRKNINVTSPDDPLPYYYSNVYGYAYRKRLKMALSLLGEDKFQRLLEIGTGSGIFLPELSKRCGSLVGFDIHGKINLVMDMLKRESKKAHLCRADISGIPFIEDSFDCIVCLSVLEFIEKLNFAVEEIYRVAEKGGTVIIGAPVLNAITDQLYYLCGNKDHKARHASSHIDIIRSFKSRFCVDSIITFPRLVPLRYSLFFVMKCSKH